MLCVQPIPVSSGECFPDEAQTNHTELAESTDANTTGYFFNSLHVKRLCLFDGLYRS